MADRGVRLLAIITAALALAAQEARAEPRAVIELFTSQGCSSCPPADRLLGELKRDPTLVTLSLAIDYWDYLGWKDTLALPGHANRQKAYSWVRGDGRVYTPQVVVNGSTEALGSDRRDIEHAIAQTHRNPATLALPVTLSVAAGQLAVAAPAAKNGESGEVWLCPLASAVPVPIVRGENTGHTITYHNVVRRWIKIGEWSSAAATWNIPIKDFQASDVDAVAVMVQSGTTAKPGPILGAAITALP